MTKERVHPNIKRYLDRYMDLSPEPQDIVWEGAEFPREDSTLDAWTILIEKCMRMADQIHYPEGVKKQDLTVNDKMHTICKLIMMFPNHTTGQEMKLLLLRRINEHPNTSGVFLLPNFSGVPGFNRHIAKILKDLKRTFEQAEAATEEYTHGW